MGWVHPQCGHRTSIVCTIIFIKCITLGPDKGIRNTAFLDIYGLIKFTLGH